MSCEPLRVLVPASGTRTAACLVEIAAALVADGGLGTVLSVVEVPEDRSLSEGALLARRRRALLRRLSEQHADHPFRAEVATARSREEGIRQTVAETQPDLMILGWHPQPTRPGRMDLEDLITNPPCDLALVKPGRNQGVTRVLLPVRGGPHALLAVRIAEAVARSHEAQLTLLHVTAPHWDALRRAKEERFFIAARREVTYERTSDVHVEADSIEDVLLVEAAGHDIVVMGAAARDVNVSSLVGRLPSRIAAAVGATAIVVKTAEPVTGKTFGLAGEQSERNVSQVVDRWFAENTFHSHEFRNLRYLIDVKERQNQKISLVLPTLNEERTVGKILSVIKRQLVDGYPLIDEMIVVDSESEDRTVEIVEALGVPVFEHPAILPQYGSYRGKGEALWKSLAVTSGDIVVWIDSDITGIHPKFVYGLIGPLLTEPDLSFVKGFYRRPLNLGGERQATGGGRVTELTARPLINLFYPELSGLVQPLAGEMAGRRAVLESVPFFTGYGVETGLLIDILDQFKLHSIGQTDLEERVHRNQSLLSLSKMAFAIIQVVVKRLGDRNRLALIEDVNTSMKLIHYSPTELFLEVKEIEEHERPPMKSVQEYADRRGSRELVGAGVDAGDA